MNILPVSTSGYVYLVWAVGTPRYKVGKSKNPPKRLESLNQQSCYPLKLIESCWFDDCDRQEKRVHRLLDRWRVHGEWFELPETFLSYTKVWLNDPRCFDFKGASNDVIVFYRNTQSSREVWLKDLQAEAVVDLPSKCSIPSDDSILWRVITLLGNFSKLAPRNRFGIAKELEALINVSPSNSEEADKWKLILKKLRKVKQNDNKNSIAETTI